MAKEKNKTDESVKPQEEAAEESYSFGELLTAGQLETYNTASPQQQKWLQAFVRTGNPNTATKLAYPEVKPNSRHTITHRNRVLFGISVADLYRSQGVDELMIVKKTKLLLRAKRITRTYSKGEETEEITEEDTYAINAGLKIAKELLNMEPPKKSLHGEDPDNPFTSIADAIKSASKTAPDSTIPESNKG